MDMENNEEKQENLNSQKAIEELEKFIQQLNQDSDQVLFETTQEKIEEQKEKNLYKELQQYLKR